VSDKPSDKTPRGPLRALGDWLRGTVTPPPASDPSLPSLELPPEEIPERIGHYAILRKLGRGGMGIVYAARDERLERTVAVKTMESLADDETGRKRFWREARAAASVNHPNVCQLYEIGEDAGRLFIVMELLEGEPLGERMRRGPFSVAEAVPIGLGVLSALTALHTRGIIHRDLKPSNVFLTPHGVKLLDFGLAKWASPEDSPSPDSSPNLTRTGVIAGTPRYMAPEQVTGDPIDIRTDLFSTGTILFEMLAGRPAFAGRNVVEILHATLHEQPPALSGSPAVVAADRVIRHALAKRPVERFPSADVMADELRAVAGGSGADTPALARPLTRLVVLPFRVLRPDPETDFLAFSLPDAIATSLSSIGSLVVRSSATAARFAGEAPDLKALATEADVDRVVMGTILRAGDQLRATAQLVEAPSGTLLTSQTVQSALADLFRLQDDVARRVVDALSVPLGGAVSSPTMDAPRDGGAYQLYLRANQLAKTYDGLPEARELYERALELDSRFAPAWAHLGRAHRVIGKYFDDSADSFARAEPAFRRALELNPRLTVAHKFFAQLEADKGQATEAVVRLLREADRHGNDPELFAGLVHACRYAGLYEHAIAAHTEARRLDPNVPTSIAQTILMTGDVEALLALEERPLGGSGDEGIRVIALGLAGRRDEARGRLRNMQQIRGIPAFQPWTEYLLAWLERRPDDMVGRMLDVGRLKIREDPEAIFQEGWLLCDVGAYDRGLPHLRRAVDRGYFASPALAGRPQFDALRGEPEFQKILADAEAGRERALAAFREAGGERLLGRRAA
jgi:serine/threonine protein kinase/tetratricopeptide (TPR) repeat protein